MSILITSQILIGFVLFFRFKTSAIIPCFYFLLFILQFFLFPNFFLKSLTYPKNYLVGAHYYSWFPENWKAGHIGDYTEPPVQPALGKYNSSGKNVFSTHLSWAKEAGIDFLIYDWWPARRDLKARIATDLKNHPNLDGLQFSIHFETLALKEKHDQSFPGENPNIMQMTEVRAERLKNHFLSLASTLMQHDAYLRIDNKPVIFLYATRHIVGDLAAAISEARKAVKEKTGLDLFIVGDEVFFNALSKNEKLGIYLLDHHEADWQRLSAFDAITSYNPYDATKLEHGGSDGAEKFLDDVSSLYRQYSRYAKMLNISFIPTVLPGYNDRGVRLGENHYVIPRDYSGKSFLQESLKRWAFPYVDKKIRMFTVTSFNEWNEGTQIEPSEEFSEQVKDKTGEYLQGERYSAYANRHLDELSEFSK